MSVITQQITVNIIVNCEYIQLYQLTAEVIEFEVTEEYEVIEESEVTKESEVTEESELNEVWACDLLGIC